MRVVTFNLHAGVDGWGRPTKVLDTIADLDADILILPETWRGDDGTDFYEYVSTTHHMTGAFAPLARGERVTTGTGTKRWQPRLAHLTGERGMYFQEHRGLTAQQTASRATLTSFESGGWGLSLLTRLELLNVEVIALGRLPRERVQRAFICARVRDNGHEFYVLAVHGAHLSHGSHLQYRKITKFVDTLEKGVPVLIAGDFNCWRPLLRILLPKWRTLARGRTWPTPHPHSQIDQILGRGPWVVAKSFTRDGGSDHRALVSDVTLP